MSKTSKTTEDAAQAIQDAVSQMQKMGFGALPLTGADWMARMNTLGSEVMQFMAERVQQDVDLQQRMLACKDVKELQKIQAEFLQTAINRYTEESGKLLEMYAKAWMPDSKSD